MAISYRLVERFCEGKFRDQRNEDRIYLGQHFLAVVDGSSGSALVAGRPGGIVAAETVVNVLNSLPGSATIDDFVGLATTTLAEVGQNNGASAPSAAAVVFALGRRQIWRIGDCPFAIDDHWHLPDQYPHERAFFAFRSMMVSGYAHTHESKPGDADELLERTRRDWLAMTRHWANSADAQFAFAALNERHPPDRFIECFDVPVSARTVFLASDGALVAPAGQRGPADVEDMIERINQVKMQDPTCTQLFPYWRGFLDGSSYLDDTTLLRIAL